MDDASRDHSRETIQSYGTRVLPVLQEHNGGQGAVFNVVPILLSRGRYEGSVTSGNAFTRTTLSSILPVPEKEFRISADG